MILIASLMGLYQLQSEKAKYDGRDLILNEAVEITHPIGRINARKAVLQNFKMDKRSPFQKLILDGQVCVHAQTPNRDINLFADRAEGEVDAGSLFAFQSLRCLGSVEIATSDGFNAKGGEARYQALASKGGAIELIPSSLSQYCFLTHERDHLEARKVRFEMDTIQIICDEPKGEIDARWKKNTPIAFHAHRLKWQKDLTLEGDVSLTQSFSLHSDLIRLSFSNDGQGELTEVMTEGPTHMAFQGKDSTLDCEGRLFLDPAVRQLMTAQPLHYHDERIRLEALSGRLTYDETGNQLQPEALYCEGSVRLISSIIQNQESFALAEQLVYFPATRTIILSCRSPNRVLFWQSSGEMTLSAPEVQVRFDSKTKKETVRGIGDVHFRFTMQEENTIETIFSKYL
ncbi:MAG: hypothetical protein HW387_1636 [Parachlamydiales bacterium]|nr:hypothetical protein [Parachlamydiales bacterium]